MGLAEYRKKRHFGRTPEPSGERRVAPGHRFVVQKHAASHLHYDFRLELDGVLKSWAIPKGPSLDPKDKRLAMPTEDHPLDYVDFEGIIPEDEYGGGTVIVWDAGEWVPEGDPHEGLRTGRLTFELRGDKLRGRWSLVRAGRPDPSGRTRWLLMKRTDEHARAASEGALVDEAPESVKTGRTLDEVAAARDAVWSSDRPPESTRRVARSIRRAPKKAVRPRTPPIAASGIDGARRAALPGFVAPELATLVERPPSGDEWLHEMKFDGYRILCRIAGGEVELFSRSGADWTAQFPTVVEAARALDVRTALLDGEVAVLLPNGTTSFQALQNAMSQGSAGEIVYFAFDLLHLGGYDLTGAPLEERKRVLESIVGADGATTIRFSGHVIGRGDAFFENACRLELEGIVSKRRDAAYRSGRTREWLKTKCARRQEVIIGGYTDPAAPGRTGFGALLLGVRDDKGALTYAGKVGTGFTQQSLRELRRRLGELEQDASPFHGKVPREARAHWVRPELVAEIAFTEWTADGRLRHPSFQGLREDKPASEVVRERAVPVGGRRKASPRRSAKRRGRAASSDDSVAGIVLTHADRVLYPEQGVTKRDLALYYERVADWILPHLRDRPTTLVRCPDGRHKECFYQKHVGRWAPEALRRVSIREKTKTGIYLVVDTLPALVGLVQLGILEIHTWNAKAAHLEQPDRIVLDLDPGPGVAWSAVVETAVFVRDELAAVGLESFVKTTGGKGLHVVAPIAVGRDWDACYAFSRAFAEALVAKRPKLLVATSAKSERHGRIFVDYLRNVRGATAVAAYSTRAKPNAPVSVPLTWRELTRVTSPDAFTIASVPQRLERLRADPWAEYWRLRQKLP